MGVKGSTLGGTSAAHGRLHREGQTPNVELRPNAVLAACRTSELQWGISVKMRK